MAARVLLAIAFSAVPAVVVPVRITALQSKRNVGATLVVALCGVAHSNGGNHKGCPYMLLNMVDPVIKRRIALSSVLRRLSR